MQPTTAASVAAIRRGDEIAAAGPATETVLADLSAARAAVDDLARHTRLITAHARNLELFADDVNALEYTALARIAVCDRQAAALYEFGLDPLVLPPAKVARVVADSRVRDTLLGVLCHWHLNSERVSAAHRRLDECPDGPTANVTVTARLEEAIRATRLLCGGAYSRWQELLDRKDIPGLVASAASPDGLSFRSTLVAALAWDLRIAKPDGVATRDFLRTAVERYPQDVWLREELYLACLNRGDIAEAHHHIAAVSALRPDSKSVHVALGATYFQLRAYDEAEAACRKAISQCPGGVWAHELLICALMKKENWRGALVAYREAVRLAPRFADNPRKNFRYDAACMAVMLANGQGANAPPPSERPAYRREALALLTADLAAKRKLAEVDPNLVHRWMEKQWLEDEDLESVRDPEALRALPPDERQAWEKVWADVRDLRDRTAPPVGSPNAKK